PHEAAPVRHRRHAAPPHAWAEVDEEALDEAVATAVAAYQAAARARISTTRVSALPGVHPLLDRLATTQATLGLAPTPRRPLRLSPPSTGRAAARRPACRCGGAASPGPGRARSRGRPRWPGSRSTGTGSTGGACRRRSGGTSSGRA